MSGKPSIVLLCSDGNSTRAVYIALRQRFGAVTVLMEQPVPRLNVIRNRLRRLGVLTAFGQLLFLTIIVPVLQRTGRKRTDQLKEELGSNEDIRKQDLIRVNSVNSESARQTLRDMAPRVVVVQGTRIICVETLQSTDASFINMHAGITPLYRGVHGGYWALAEKRRDLVGTTIHYVDAGVDTGKVIGQAFFEVAASDNFATYPYLHTQAGMPFLLDAVDMALSGRKCELNGVSDLPSKLRYHPTIWAYLTSRWRDGVR